METIANFETWSEKASLTEEEGKFIVRWTDKIHGVEPFEKPYSSLREAVRRYNEFMNTNFERLNPDGTLIYQRAIEIEKYQACECEKGGMVNCKECCYLPGDVRCLAFIRNNDCKVIEI